MPKIPKLVKNSTEAHILSSAATLFACDGYNGVSTRDIAANAGVNEVTVYRHFPRKRDLFMAVLDRELLQVKVGGDLLTRLAEAEDARVAVSRAFDLVTTVLSSSPELVRLLQYSALELGEEIDPLLRRHLGELVEVVAHYLEPWAVRGELRCANAKILVLSLVSIVISHSTLQRLFLHDGTGAKTFLNVLADSCELFIEQAG